MTLDAVGYDAELRRHNEVLRRACGVQPRDHVLDIGCGTGLTTREAALAAPAGSALGVDTSAAAVERARSLTQGLGNVAFEQADAQVHDFPRERFDLAISRFGTMFFDDPVAAFTNIGRALRPGGRLVMMVWQNRELNEWDVVIRRSAAGPGSPAATFSLADPPTVRKILHAAGFTHISFTDVREPVYYGPDVPAALNWVGGFAGVTTADALRETFQAHLRDDGVWLDSRAWIITATLDTSTYA